MSIDPADAPRQLPSRPNLRHLKSQARDLLAAGSAASLTDAQLQVARRSDTEATARSRGLRNDAWPGAA